MTVELDRAKPFTAPTPAQVHRHQACPSSRDRATIKPGRARRTSSPQDRLVPCARTHERKIMPERWSARMIGPDADFAGAPLLRKEFRLEPGHGEVAEATLHATARGVFTASINGSPVADEVLTPGWSSYEWRLRYRTYDVTHLLTNTPSGEVVLGLALGNGWHRGRLTWSGGRGFYGDELGALAQLEIAYTDGHRQIVATDQTWQAGASAVLANDLYDGQTIDARLVDTAWQLPGCAGNRWAGVHAQEFDPSTLTPYLGPVAHRQQELRPMRVWTSPAGATLVDFGQNLVGWLRVTVQGQPGVTITLRHAEVLENEELGTRPLRTARATDRFVLSGGNDVFEPTLTFHGFRYV